MGKRDDDGKGRQKDGSWDSSKCNHPNSFGRTWLSDGRGGEREICDGCGRSTGNTR